MSCHRLFVLATVAAGVFASCPSNWTLLEDHCYWWTTSTITGHQLADACRALHPNATSASVHSSYANAQLSQYMLHGLPAWLGLHLADGGKQFVWGDGSWPDYWNWDEGEPSGPRESCVYINADPATGEWAACDCYQWNLPYICQLVDSEGEW